MRTNQPNRVQPRHRDWFLEKYISDKVHQDSVILIVSNNDALAKKLRIMLRTKGLSLKKKTGNPSIVSIRSGDLSAIQTDVYDVVIINWVDLTKEMLTEAQRICRQHLLVQHITANPVLWEEPFRTLGESESIALPEQAPLDPQPNTPGFRMLHIVDVTTEAASPAPGDGGEMGGEYDKDPPDLEESSKEPTPPEPLAKLRAAFADDPQALAVIEKTAGTTTTTTTTPPASDVRTVTNLINAGRAVPNYVSVPPKFVDDGEPDEFEIAKLNLTAIAKRAYGGAFESEESRDTSVEAVISVCPGRAPELEAFFDEEMARLRPERVETPTEPEIEPSTKYLLLTEELKAKRKAAGGSLSEEEESDYVERLDTLWRQLSEEDQEEVNSLLKDQAIEVESKPDVNERGEMVETLGTSPDAPEGRISDEPDPHETLPQEPVMKKKKAKKARKKE